MSRVEIIGDATLYLGDCREIMPTLAEPADLLLTDAPYEVTKGGSQVNKPESSFRGGWLQDYANGGAIVTLCPWHTWLPLAPAALAENAHVYLFSNDRELQAARHHAEAAGFRFHRLLVWHKRSAVPARWYQQTCEFVLFMRQGKAFRINDPSSQTLASLFQRDESGTITDLAHPTEKPAALCRHYIENSTKRGGLVLDPFMGSGTTGVAAISAGRRFVGCEIEPKWFDIACRRIGATQHQPTLFEAV